MTDDINVQDAPEVTASVNTDAAVVAQMQAEMAELRAQNEELKKKAKTGLKNVGTSAGSTDVSVVEYLEELVPVMLFKDSEKYKDDVVIGHNGKFYQIQRGMTVHIPRAVSMILESHYRQQMISADMQDVLADEAITRYAGIGVKL